MPIFTYHPPFKKVSEIDQKTLQHRYFAQLAPDGIHLVPGMLQQGERPAIGNWLDVANITRDFPRRYFVQYTDFNTLVPGSLIQGDRYPAGRWKEVKKAIPPLFRFFYNGGESGHEWTANFTDNPPWGFINDLSQFNYLLINEDVYSTVYPGRDIFFNYLTLQLFYFHGSFDQFNRDISKLISFADPASLIRLSDGSADHNIINSNNFSDGIIFLINNIAPAGDYMIVAGVLNEENAIENYIVLEDFIRKLS